MALIHLEEKSSVGTDGTNAMLSFEHEDSKYHLTITDPFTKKQEQLLEWYFEEHFRFPFTRQVRAQKAAASITAYGEDLFEQVFSHPEIYAKYQSIRDSGLTDLQIEITGSPKFHALHWEALKDPDLAEPLALQAFVIRKNHQSEDQVLSVRPSPTINVLIVTARPADEHEVGYRTISRPLIEALHHAKLPVQVNILRPGSYRALESHLCKITEKHGQGYYHVIHFDTHGAVINNKAFLFLEDEQGTRVQSVKGTELANLLRSHRVPIAILNACQSGKQIGTRETSLGSRLSQEGVQMVLAMGYSVSVSAAELLMVTLYQRLFAGDDLSAAIRLARIQLYNSKKRNAYYNQQIDLEDWLLPVVYQNYSVRLQLRDFTSQERQHWLERELEAKRYTPAEPAYGFVGRDLDILQIERRLLFARNILLLRGMGGAGKTTLLKHLGAWWYTSGFVQRVFYFSYDKQAWTQQQLMATIAQDLYGPRYYSDFQPLSLNEQKDMLTADLCATNYLLILDNLESITGSHLTTQHILSKEERSALQNFLTDLAQGKTFILLGSRNSEDWLAAGSFEDNIYDLPGLDPEAASMLVDRILEHHHAARYREDKDLGRLVKLLDGYPLALEVVLANLKQQTPKEILEALQAGDVKLDIEGGYLQDKDIFELKTKSILYCIDYSYRNLSSDAQTLLLCLAPFTSVLNLGFLNEYIELLKQQAALASLPVEQLVEVVQEARNWGLLIPDAEWGSVPDSPTPFYLRLQPVLSFFLRSRLLMPEQEERRLAIETAFRQHYDMFCRAFDEQRGSQVWQVLMNLEYENLMNALDLTLAAQSSISQLYSALTGYLETTRDYQRALELGEKVLSGIESYSPEQLSGLLGVELWGILEEIGEKQQELNRYQEAETSFYRALSIAQGLKWLDLDETEKLTADTYSYLGRLSISQRKWVQAEEHFEHALKIYLKYDEGRNQASIYFQLGRLAREQRKWEQAEHYFQQALPFFLESNYHKGQADIYSHLGTVAQENLQLEQAEHYYHLALQIYKELNDYHSQADAFHDLGVNAQFQRKLTEAEQYYQEALLIFIMYNDSHQQALTYNQLGRVAQEQSQWEQAEHYFQKALLIYKAVNELYGQTQVYHNLGATAQVRGQLTNAEQFFQQALLICIELQDRYQQAKTLHNLGVLAWQQQQWEQAERYSQQALQIFFDEKAERDQAKTYQQLGVIAEEQQQWGQAELYYQQALRIYQKHDDRDGQVTVLLVRANRQLGQKNWKQARDFFEQALSLLVAEYDFSKKARALRDVGRACFELGDHEQGIQYLQQTVDLYNTLDDEPEAVRTQMYLEIMRQRLVRAETKGEETFSDEIELLEAFLSASSGREMMKLVEQQPRLLTVEWLANIEALSQALPDSQAIRSLQEHIDTLKRVRLHIEKTSANVELLNEFAGADWATRHKLLLENADIFLSEDIELSFNVLIDITTHPASVEVLEGLRIMLRLCSKWGVDLVWYFELQMRLGEGIEIPPEFEPMVMQIAALLSNNGAEATAIEQAIEALQTLLGKLPSNVPTLFRAALMYDLADTMRKLPHGHASRQLDRIENYYRDALPGYEAANRPMTVAMLHMRLGDVLLEERAWTQAREEFEQALSSPVAEGDRRGQAYSLINLGLIRFKLGEREQGMQNVQQAAALFRAARDEDGVHRSELLLSQMDALLSHPEQETKSGLSIDPALLRAFLAVKSPMELLQLIRQHPQLLSDEWFQLVDALAAAKTDEDDKQALRERLETLKIIRADINQSSSPMHVLIDFAKADWSKKRWMLKDRAEVLLSEQIEPLFERLLAAYTDSDVVNQLKRLRMVLRRCRIWGLDPAWYFQLSMRLSDDIEIPPNYEPVIRQIATVLSRQEQDGMAREQAIEMMQGLLREPMIEAFPTFKAALLFDLANIMYNLPTKDPLRRLDYIETCFREALVGFEAAARHTSVTLIQRALGQVLSEQGRYADALEPLQKAAHSLQRHESHKTVAAWTLSAYANALDSLGWSKDALVTYTEALALLPDSAPILRNRAETLIHLRRLEEAEADLAHAKEIDRNEDNPYLWYRRAQIAVARGNGRQADLLLDKVLELDAAEDVVFLRGQNAWLQGNITIAQQMLQQAFEQANEGNRSAMHRELECLFDEHPELSGKDVIQTTLMIFER